MWLTIPCPKFAPGLAFLFILLLSIFFLIFADLTLRSRFNPLTLRRYSFPQIFLTLLSRGMLWGTVFGAVFLQRTTCKRLTFHLHYLGSQWISYGIFKHLSLVRRFHWSSIFRLLRLKNLWKKSVLLIKRPAMYLQPRLSCRFRNRLLVKNAT